MANKHGLKAKEAGRRARAMKGRKKKKIKYEVYTGNESGETRYKISYKRRIKYLKNKQTFPRKGKSQRRKIVKAFLKGDISEKTFETKADSIRKKYPRIKIYLPFSR